jgi:hypothetical protein
LRLEAAGTIPQILEPRAEGATDATKGKEACELRLEAAGTIPQMLEPRAEGAEDATKGKEACELRLEAQPERYRKCSSLAQRAQRTLRKAGRERQLSSAGTYRKRSSLGQRAQRIVY